MNLETSRPQSSVIASASPLQVERPGARKSREGEDEGSGIERSSRGGMVELERGGRGGSELS